MIAERFRDHSDRSVLCHGDLATLVKADVLQRHIQRTNKVSLGSQDVNQNVCADFSDSSRSVHSVRPALGELSLVFEVAHHGDVYRVLWPGSGHLSRHSDSLTCFCPPGV